MQGGQLCDELIVEIFSRLPSKTLLRCRSLSKSWYSFIGSPDFIRMHSIRSRQKLLIRHRTYKVNKKGDYEGFYTLHPQDQLPLCPTRGYIGITPLQFPCPYSWIVGYCDGIVCLFDYSHNRITIWNPSIRRKLTLPDCPRKCYSENEIGFGYDPITDDYKIVSIPGFIGEHVESPYVYTMKTNVWCAIASPMPLFRRLSTKACFVSGAFYWLVQRCYDGRELYILTFDLSTHVFSHIVSPDANQTVALAAIQGSLAVIINESSRDQWIWVKRDASWSVEIKLKSEEDEDGDGDEYEVENKGDLKEVLQLGTTGDMIFDLYSKGFQIYNPKTEAFSGLVDFNDAYFLLDIVWCVENLQLLDMGTSC